MSCSILHTNGWLYPKGYIETAQDNVFYSADLVSKTSIESPETGVFIYLFPQNIIAGAQASQANISFVFVAYSNKIIEKAQATIVDLHTNPVYFEPTSSKAQQENSIFTDLYPDWYKPHRDQIGTGIVFKQGNRAHRIIIATNKTPSRSDKRHIEAWRPPLECSRKHLLRWVEKRRIDPEKTTPFGVFRAETRKLILNNIKPHAIDHNVGLLIDILNGLATGLLLNAGHPHAVDILIDLLIDILKDLGIKFDLVVPVVYAADRVRFLIRWGIGGLGCMHRYIPPLGNNVELELKTPEKVVV